MDVVVTYDVSTVDEAGVRRLTAVAKVCEQYGVRVQKSVFEARLSDVQLERLVAALRDTFDERADSIVIYRLSTDTAASRLELGRSVGLPLGRPWIF